MGLLPEAPWSVANPGPPARYVRKGELKGRITQAAERALKQHNAEQARKPMTPEERRERADDMRRAADALEGK